MGTGLSERQEGDGIVLHVEIPGIGPDDVKVEVDDGVLTISGEHEEKSEEESESFVRRERRYGSFSRSIAVPSGIAAEDVEVISENGAIEVKIPLPQEADAEAGG